MPYYQIKHLKALDNYLELLGVPTIFELPKGKGNPPREDPQIFLGAISIGSTHPVSAHFDNAPLNNENSFTV